MSFIVSALPADAFRPLFAMSDEALAARGVERRTVTEANSDPCRLTVEDAAIGETVLLMNYEHQPADTPFRARHAIFVRQAPTLAPSAPERSHRPSPAGGSCRCAPSTISA